MKITRVRAIPMSDPVPPERQHRTDLGTKVKSDATLILVETDRGLTGIGTSLGAPPVVGAIWLAGAPPLVTWPAAQKGASRVARETFVLRMRPLYWRAPQPVATVTRRVTAAIEPRLPLRKTM